MQRRSKAFELLASVSLLAIFLLASPPTRVPGQTQSSKKINGYKIHRTKVTVSTKLPHTKKPDGTYVFVELGRPYLTGSNLSGFVIGIEPSATVLTNSGSIDAISFQNFSINGRTVQVRSVTNRFKFKKGKQVTLEKPILIDVGFFSSASIAIQQLFKSSENWRITGKILVFGKFKKGFFKFKRVIPVEISLDIPSPLNS